MIRAALLALALATAVAALHAAPVTPSNTSFVTTDGVRLHVLEAGTTKPGRPTLAFVPGWSMPASIWSGQVEAFAGSHKVVALDPRGQGASEVPGSGYTTERRAEDLHEFVSRHSPVVLVTWSMASLEALHFIGVHGHKAVRALVIVDSSVGEGPAPPRADPATGFQAQLRRDREKVLEDFVRGLFKRPQPESRLAALRDGALRLPLEASLSLFPGERIPREHWRSIVNAFPKPLLYVVTPQFSVQAQSLRKNRPATEVAVFDKAGHALFVDEPERFSTVLRNFLSRHKLN